MRSYLVAVAVVLLLCDCVAPGSSEEGKVFELNVTRRYGLGPEKELVGTIRINTENYTEPVDIVYNFCLEHNLTLSKRESILSKICQHLPCHRRRPIVYTKTVHKDNPESSVVGTVRVLEGQEPADVVDAFYKAHDRVLDYFDGNRLKDIADACEAATCTRSSPIVYSRDVIHSGRVVGELYILESDEPAAAVHAFSEKHKLPVHVRKSVLDHACTQLKCKRREIIVPEPLYPREQLQLEITSPKNGTLVLGPTIVFTYEMEVFVTDILKKYKNSKHRIHACFHAKNQLGDIISRNYDPGVACPQDLVGRLHGIPPGDFVLEGWLTNGPDPLQLVTDISSILFTSIDIPNAGGFTSSRNPNHGGTGPSGMKISSLKSRAKQTNMHDVIASMLQAEWPNVAGKIGVQDAYTSALSKMVSTPDIKNDVENVIRAAMHGFHLPLLTMTPADTKWYVATVAHKELRGLKSLNSKRWIADGSVDACVSIESNWHAIFDDYCQTRRPAQTTAEEHKPSSVILSMVRDEEVLKAMPRTAVMVGTSWNSFMSDMTVWDGNHRLVAFYGDGEMNARGLKCGGNAPSSFARKPIRIYIGISPGFEINNEKTGQSLSLFCALMKLDKEQQRAPLDMSEWSRKIVHKKIAKANFGDRE